MSSELWKNVDVVVCSGDSWDVYRHYSFWTCAIDIRQWLDFLRVIVLRPRIYRLEVAADRLYNSTLDLLC